MSSKAKLNKVAPKVAPQPEEKAPEAVISFEDFLNQYPGRYHYGLIASFTFEDKRSNQLKPRTTSEWINSFEEQSNRVY